MTTKREYVLEGAGLRVRFTLGDDRWSHAIELADGSRWITVLRSREGSADEAWPASPPFQSLHVESRENGDVVLLVGMAGKSHWSASVELDAKADCLRFDVACRAAAGAGVTLGSGYLAATRHATDPRRAIVDVEGRSEESLEVAICEPSLARLCAESDSLAIIAGQPSQTSPGTIRWAYTVTRRVHPTAR